MNRNLRANLTIAERNMATLTVIVLALTIVIAGCNFPGSGATATATESAAISSTTPTRDDAASQELVERKVLLAAADDASDVAIIELKNEVLDLANQSSLALENITTLSDEVIGEGVFLVFIFEDDPGIVDFASRYPEVQFVSVGGSEITTSVNLSVIDADSQRPDYQAFVAGYIAAMTADDWRAGVVAIGGGAEGEAIGTGFINGARYFCGLCRTAFPPFYEYPQSYQLDTNGQGWGSLVAIIQENRLGVIYLAPIENFASIVQDGLQLSSAIIGDGARPDVVPEDQWVAAVRYSAVDSLRSVWNDLIEGKGGQVIQWELQIVEVNRDLLSEGREKAARELIEDLEAGFISTGYENLSE